MDVTFIAVARSDHALFKVDHPLTPDDLMRHVQVVVRDSGIKHPRDEGWLGADLRCTVSSMEASLATVEAGLAYAWLPEHLVRNALERKVIQSLPLVAGGSRNVPLSLVLVNADLAGPAARAAASRDMGNNGCAPVQFRDSPEVDRERQYDLLPFAQPEIGGLNEYAGGAQIDGLAQFPPTTGDSDIDNGSCTVPRVQAAFHLNRASRHSSSCASRPEPLCRSPALHHARFNLITHWILCRPRSVGKRLMQCPRPWPASPLSEPGGVIRFTARYR
jgi:hypothetical protein